MAANATTPIPEAVEPVVANEPETPALTTTTPMLASAEPRNLGPYLMDARYATDTESAFRNLLALWGAEYRSDSASACEQAAAQELACLFQRGSWSNLRRLNRPVILELIDDGGNEHQVVLKALGEDWGELSFGGETVQVSLEEITKFWFGDHLLLWRPPLNQVRQLSPGMRDEGVEWLRSSLTRINGQGPAPEDPMVYDPALEARVRAYQRDRRLNVDGLVGVHTQILINTDLAAPDTPLLVRAN